ncbi:MAG: hypothetical protein JWM85_2574, partial [Acidimicrobiaceae bacterium]|nr:hypothetical protein [Acidimicrobiaceae bacterium]
SCFGERLEGLEQLHRASQQLQHDGLRYLVEANLRRAPRSSGVIPWQFNESYPNAWCTAAVDYLGDPKPAYFAVRRAYRSRHVCATFSTCAWGGLEEVRATVVAWGGPGFVSARIVDTLGCTVSEERFALDEPVANNPVVLGELRVGRSAIRTDAFVLDLSFDNDDNGPNRYLMSRTEDLSPLLELAPAQLEASIEADSLWLRHLAGPAALGLVASDARAPGATGWLVLEDNLVDLLPGEQRRIGLCWRAAPLADRVVRLSGWNLETRLLT